jgi:hypothetical protein
MRRDTAAPRVGFQTSNPPNPIRLLPLAMNYCEYHQRLITQQIENSLRKAVGENPANLRLAPH